MAVLEGDIVAEIQRFGNLSSDQICRQPRSNYDETQGQDDLRSELCERCG